MKSMTRRGQVPIELAAEIRSHKHSRVLSRGEVQVWLNYQSSQHRVALLITNRQFTEENLDE